MRLITRADLKLALKHYKSGKHKPCCGIFSRGEYCCPITAASLEGKKGILDYWFIVGFDDIRCGDETNFNEKQYKLGIEFRETLKANGFEVVHFCEIAG